MGRVLAFFCLILLYSCSSRSGEEQSLFYDDGKPKPVVALVPVIDRSGHDLPWDLSDEFTLSVKDRLLQKQDLFLTYPSKTLLQNEVNPFGADLAWMKASFPKKEFVVFMELIEHKEVPVFGKTESLPEDSPAELKMSVRLRVVDLRGQTPKIILQELIHDAQYLPKQFTRYNFFQIPWGKESYSITPLGLAHAKVVKEIASRVEDYILIAKAK